MRRCDGARVLVLTCTKAPGTYAPTHQAPKHLHVAPLQPPSLAGTASELRRDLAEAASRPRRRALARSPHGHPLTVGDEIASANDFGRVLRAADERNEIEHGIDGATQHALAPHGAHQRRSGNNGADERHGADEFSGHSALPILEGLS